MNDSKEEQNKYKEKKNTKEPEDNKTPSAKKDTKKWCKGKVGIEHILKCVKYQDIKRQNNNSSSITYSWRLLICTKCGKELDYYYSFGKQEPPAWVDC